MAQVKRTYVYHFTTMVVGILLAIVNIRYLLIENTFLIPEHRDVVFPSNLLNIFNRYFYIWSESGSNVSYEGISRLWYSFLAFFSQDTITFPRFMFLFHYFVIFFIPYISFFYLLKNFLGYDSKISYLVSLVIAFNYSFNPYVIQAYSPPHPYTFALSLLPALVLITLQMLRSDNKMFIFLFAFVITLTVTSIIRYIIFTSIVVFISTSTYIALNQQKIKFVHVAKKFVYGALLFLSLNFYWMFPTISSLGPKQIIPTYVVTYESAKMFSSAYTPVGIFTLTAAWWPPLRLKPFPFLPDTIFSVIPFFVPMLAFISLLFLNRYDKKDKILIIIGSLICLLGFFLWKGITNFNLLFSIIYEFLLFSTPSSIGWMFRVPGYFTTLVILGFTLCTAVLLTNLFKTGHKTKYIGVLLCILLIVSSCIIGWQRFTGDLDGVLRKGYYLEDRAHYDRAPYNKSIILLSDYDGNFKPHHSGKPYINLPNDLSRYLEFSVKNGDEKAVYYLLSILGADAFITNLKMDNTTFYYLYPESKEGINIYLPYNKSNSVYIQNQIASITDFNKNLYGSLSAFYPSLTITSKGNENKNTVMEIDPNKLSSIIFLSTNSQMIKPFDLTIHHNPSTVWSKASTNDPLHGEWHPYLEKRGIENWQSDYGKGLVFTWATSKLNKNLISTSNDLIDQWTFESINDLETWKNYNYETQFGALHPLTLDNGALKAELWNSTWGWKTINSPPITVDYGNWYRLELRLRGENIQSAHIKAVEYNESGQSINAKTLQTIGTGNIDWKNITLDYTPEKPETKHIQLQIWHGHETTQPLPNTIWIDHLKVYDLERFIEPVTLEIPYTIPETDQYILLARVFQNQQGGRILIKNDQETYPIYTRDQLNKFTWIQLDNATLQQGQHKLTLTNLEGFNAVNLFALVPAQEYREAQTRLTETLQDKRIIHVLEAETDLYHNNATTTNKYGAEASNGETLELTPGSTTWRTIETAKPGDYTIAVRGKGNLNIKIDEQTYQTHTNQLDWTYLDPIHLETGTHRIEITQHPTQSHQWDFEDNETSHWTATSPTNQTLTLTKNPYGDGTSLKTEITAPITIWKTVTTPLIPATPETTYTWSLQVAGENAHKAHIKILEYDENRKPLTATQVASIGDGNYAWTPVSIQYTPTPDAAHIALQIWHGHESTQPLPNRIWIDDVQVTDSQPTDLDVVWIYSTDKPGETLQDIFTVDQAPAQLIEYNKIDPTKYKATINASKPFMLSFAESYDPLWVARVNGQKITSTPLYSVINGFWIQETGLIDVTIEYTPQRWFYIGSAISITALTASLAYLATPYLREKGVTLKTITNHARKHLTRKEPPEKPE